RLHEGGQNWTPILPSTGSKLHADSQAPTAEEAFQVGYPMIYMAVMASELYLKCMVYKVHRHVPHHHVLEKLFNSLPADLKALIISRWDAEMTTTFKRELEWATQNFPHPIDTSFVGALRGASRANEELRYIWEGRDDSYTLLQNLPRMLQDIILNDLGGEKWLEWDPPLPKAPTR
ncbi:hypothetical protein, partial [Devosia sp. 66-22]|uniref:hypothetical protein n=1 Tax=Devosia sp. 66-22 TaxID=1895753 RepID=UPI000A490972